MITHLGLQRIYKLNSLQDSTILEDNELVVPFRQSQGMIGFAGYGEKKFLGARHQHGALHGQGLHVRVLGIGQIVELVTDIGKVLGTCQVSVGCRVRDVGFLKMKR